MWLSGGGKRGEGADTFQQVRTRFMAPPTCSECGSGESLPPGEITGHRISREEEQRWRRSGGSDGSRGKGGAVRIHRAMDKREGEGEGKKHNKRE